MSNILTLKWGTAKSWNLDTNEANAAMLKWAGYGTSMSAIAQHDTPDQQQALLDAIDLMDEIWLDWEGTQVSREEAKAYIVGYGKRSDA